MKRSFKLLGYLFFLFAVCPLVYGAPHLGEIFEFKQPDGSYVKVKIYGDEYFQRAEGLDGYTLVKDEKSKWIVYALLSDDQKELIPSEIGYDDSKIISQSINPGFHFKKGIKISPLSRQEKWQAAYEKLHPPPRASSGSPLAKGAASAAAAAVTGNILGLTLLIDFEDDPQTIGKAEIESFLNLPGYSGNENNGSNYDYWHEVSGGKLSYTNHVADYFRAPEPKGYYNQDTERDDRVDELILGALQNLNNQGFDYSTLATSSSRILAINILYAGSSESSWGQGLWPHSGRYRDFQADGVRSERYQMTALGSSITLRTFCHENGHMIAGWPDLYDKNDPDSYGIGSFGLMASGGRDRRDPMMPGAYLRDRAGWDVVTDLSNALPGTYYHVANSNTSFIFRNPEDNNEFFYIESRIKSDKGRNGSIRDEGLLVWHIDENGSNNNEQMTAERHYRVSVEQADGQFHLENHDNSGGSGDLFHGGYADAFTDESLPDSKWWDGGSSGLNIVNISVVGDTMSFEIQEENVTVVLVDGVSGADIRKFGGGKLVISDLPASINFRAIASREVKSISFALSGDQTHSITMDGEPYICFPNGWVPAKGSYTLSVTGFSGSGGSGEQLTRRNFDFSITTETIAYFLVDTDLDKKVMEMENNGIYNLNLLPANIGISAEPSMAVGSVSFRLFGQQSRTITESIFPYALFSDDGSGDFSPWNPSPEIGTYTVIANAFSGSGGSGSIIASREISFSFTRGPVKRGSETILSGSHYRFRQLPSGRIEVTVTVPVNLELNFSSPDGRRTQSINRFFSAGTHQFDAPVNLKKGIYILRIRDGSGVTVRKLVGI